MRRKAVSFGTRPDWARVAGIGRGKGIEVSQHREGEARVDRAAGFGREQRQVDTDPVDQGATDVGWNSGA